MREEYELEVLERYNIEVRSTRRIRGAFFCDTNEGTMLLKETGISGRRAPLLYIVLSCLETRGNIKVDTPVFTKDGELLVSSRGGKTYMLRQWYHGRECEIRQEPEAVRAAETLAALHRGLQDEGIMELSESLLSGFGAARDPVDEIRRHNRELKKIRGFIRGRVTKNEFEYLFLDSFEKMYRTAEYVLAQMESSGCSALWRNGTTGGRLMHGDYNYHNLLVSGSDMAVTNFEHMKAGIQVHDLYYFMRKAMEKYSWKQKTGQKILEAYEETRALEPAEREYIGLRLAYPEKYWKTASSYYHSNKAWLPEKNVEKLRTALRQNEEKRAFLENIFSVAIQA